MAPHIPRPTRNARKPGQFRPAGRYDYLTQDLWVERKLVKVQPIHLSMLADQSPKIKEMFFPKHRAAPARYQVRATDVKYVGCGPDEFTKAFLEMLHVFLPRVAVPPPAKPIHRGNVERVIWIAAEFQMADLERRCLDFLHANYSIRDFLRISEKYQMDELKIHAYSRLFEPKEDVELRLVRQDKPIIRTRMCLLKRTNTDPRYTSSTRLKHCAKDMHDDAATREFLLNAVVRRPGSTLRRRELCQDNCWIVDRALRCVVCEHQDSSPPPALALHPKARMLPHDARRRVLCGNRCSAFDDASGLCTTCNHPFGRNSILDLDNKRWKLCKNTCSKFDFYNCCKVCEYPGQVTPALRQNLCNEKCFWFVTTPDKKKLCVICRNEWVKGHHTYDMMPPQ